MHPYEIPEGTEDPLETAGTCDRNTLLFAVGFIPNEIDLLANAMVSFACAMQVQAFRKVNGYAFASTMCIGNLRSGMESLCAYGKRKIKDIAKIRLLFRNHLPVCCRRGIGWTYDRIHWSENDLDFLYDSADQLLCMFIKEEKEEHPEIMEEEQEIRDNLKNIRKEARDVEHILEDDIRSQIEKNNVKTGEKDRNPTENLVILLKYNPVSKVAIFGFTNPVFGVLLSAGWLGEGSAELGWNALIALALVCIGICIVNVKINTGNKTA